MLIVGIFSCFLLIFQDNLTMAAWKSIKSVPRTSLVLVFFGVAEGSCLPSPKIEILLPKRSEVCSTQGILSDDKMKTSHCLTRGTSRVGVLFYPREESVTWISSSKDFSRTLNHRDRVPVTMLAWRSKISS